MRKPLIVAGVVAAMVTMTAGGATAAPQRMDSAKRTVYLVHGFDASLTGHGHDCQRYWDGALSGLRASGWDGELITFGYYSGNTNCDVNHDGDRKTSIREVGRVLAWHLYETHSKQGKTVDILAHSMGGLVARAALSGVQLQEDGFPPFLYVEDVVTLSSPHRGAALASLCPHKQCEDMRANSSFLRWLVDSPQSAHGTDWTVIGAEDDNVVGAESATGIEAQHKVVYERGQGLDHSAVATVAEGEFDARLWHHDQGGWTAATVDGPVAQARDGLYYAARW